MEESSSPSSQQLQQQQISATALIQEYVDFNECLINEVKSFPNLWNPSIAEYKDHKKSKQAWEQIATNLNETGFNCKRLFKNLRDTFVKLKRDKCELQLKGKGEEFRTAWKYYPMLKFLNASVKHRRADLLYYNKLVKESIDAFDSSDSELNYEFHRYSAADKPPVNQADNPENTNNSTSDVNEQPTVARLVADGIAVKKNKRKRRSKGNEKMSPTQEEVRAKFHKSTGQFYDNLTFDHEDDDEHLLSRLVDSTFKKLHPSLKAKGTLMVKKLLCELEEKSLAILEQEFLGSTATSSSKNAAMISQSALKSATISRATLNSVRAVLTSSKPAYTTPQFTEAPEKKGGDNF